MFGFLSGMIGKLGAAASFTVGIGTSFICMWIGHVFLQKVPEWVAKCGCRKCGGVGTLPDRPDGGGRLSAETCDRCRGSGVDPDTPLPEDWPEKKRRRDRKKGKQSPQGLLGLPDLLTFQELRDLYGRTLPERVLDWWREVRRRPDPDVPEELRGGWKNGPQDPNTPPRPGKFVKVARPSCRRCGAKNPSFTEPPEDVGLLGRFLRWLF